MSDEKQPSDDAEAVAPPPDVNPSSSEPRRGPRRFDVRAPRATRETKASAHYAPAPRPPRAERPARAPRNEASAKVEPVAKVEPIANSEGVAKPEASARIEAIAKPAPTIEPKRRPAPRVDVASKPEPVAKPEEPSLEEQLRVLGAKPVAAVTRAKSEPKTAREVLRERTASNAKTQNQSRKRDKKRARAEASGSEDRPSRPSAAADRDSSSPPPPPVRGGRKPRAPAVVEATEPTAPRGFWAKVRAFFGGDG